MTDIRPPLGPHRPQGYAGLPLFASASGELDPADLPGVSERSDDLAKRIDAAEAPDPFSARFLSLSAALCQALDPGKIDSAAHSLARVRARGGRLFVLGGAGLSRSARQTAEAFRAECDIDAHAPAAHDAAFIWGVEEARDAYAQWLKVSRARDCDALFAISAAGASQLGGPEAHIERALELADARGLTSFTITGTSSGSVVRLADSSLMVPDLDEPLNAALFSIAQTVICESLTSHPALKKTPGVW